MKRTTTRLSTLAAAKVELEERLAEAIEQRSLEIAKLAIRSGLVDLPVDDGVLLDAFVELVRRFRESPPPTAKRRRIPATERISDATAGASNGPK